MSIGSIIIFLVVFAIGAYLAYWVITKFFPAPAQMPVLAIVGLLLLFVLFWFFFPNAVNFNVTPLRSR